MQLLAEFLSWLLAGIPRPPVMHICNVFCINYYICNIFQKSICLVLLQYVIPLK